MTKYGMVVNGLVRSIFYSNNPSSDYPDIASFLSVIQDPVDCNWTFDGTTYWSPDGTQSWTPNG